MSASSAKRAGFGTGRSSLEFDPGQANLRTVARSLEGRVKTRFLVPSGHGCRAHAASRVITVQPMKRPSRLEVPLVLALWLVFGAALATITTRVADWFVMTDELLYERLAISVYRLGSLVPHVHGQVVPNLNQLYPVLLAVPFRNDSVRQSLHDAHVLNAILMTSASVPAYVLARRVTTSWWAPWIVATLTVTLPWIALASFLLTEVVAYPVFLWAIVICQQTLVRPSARNDVVALGGLALAIVARTQFVVFVAALLLAIVGLALTTSDAGARLAGLRAAARAHVVLLGGYAVAAVVALVLLLAGHSPLGSYSQTATETSCRRTSSSSQQRTWR